MKTVETITTAKDILALVDFVCSQETEREYKLCDEQEIRLEYSFPKEKTYILCFVNTLTIFICRLLII